MRVAALIRLPRFPLPEFPAKDADAPRKIQAFQEFHAEAESVFAGIATRDYHSLCNMGNCWSLASRQKHYTECLENMDVIVMKNRAQTKAVKENKEKRLRWRENTVASSEMR